MHGTAIRRHWKIKSSKTGEDQYLKYQHVALILLYIFFLFFHPLVSSGSRHRSWVEKLSCSDSRNRKWNTSIWRRYRYSTIFFLFNFSILSHSIVWAEKHTGPNPWKEKNFISMKKKELSFNRVRPISIAFFPLSVLLLLSLGHRKTKEVYWKTEKLKHQLTRIWSYSAYHRLWDLNKQTNSIQAPESSLNGTHVGPT